MMQRAARRLGPSDDPRSNRIGRSSQRSPLFRGCSSVALDDLVRRLRFAPGRAGAVIVAQDEPGDALFVIAQGRVKVALFGENGRELTLSLLGSATSSAKCRWSTAGRALRTWSRSTIRRCLRSRAMRSSSTLLRIRRRR